MNIHNIIKTCILYFKIKKYDRMTVQPFKWYAGQIRFLTKIDDKKFIRLIFDKLVKKNKLVKIKRGKSTLYYFDPYEKKNDNENIIIKKKLIVYFD